MNDWLRCTSRFADRVYDLHVFQKKSKKGIATPQAEIELVRQRLKRAAELDQKRPRWLGSDVEIVVKDQPRTRRRAKLLVA